MLYVIVERLSRVLLHSAFRMKVIAAENIPPRGPLIVVANHQSLLDGFVVAATMHDRRLTFLSASRLFRHPLAGRFLRGVGALPVQTRRDNLASLRAAIRVLDGGGSVVVFPSGGIRASEILGGAAYLALKTDALLLPLHIVGAREALPPGRLCPSWRPIEVHVRTAFSMSHARDRHTSTKSAVAEGQAKLAAALAGESTVLETA